MNGGVAIMGYSGLAAGCPGCRHHGIFHTYIYLAPLHVPPFYVLHIHVRPCTVNVAVRLNEKKEDRQGKQRGGEREKEREREREREKIKGIEKVRKA